MKKTTVAYTIRLTEEEIQDSEDLLHRGRQLATVRNRAQILLLSHHGRKNSDIAAIVAVAPRTVSDIRRKYLTKGFRRTVYGEPRPGRPKVFDERAETELAALSCSDPPTGRKRWTLELLGSRTVKPMKKSTVSLLLKKKPLQAVEAKNVVHRKSG
jgi:putative transposase